MAKVSIELPEELIEAEVSKRVKKYEARLKELAEFDKTREKLEVKIKQLEFDNKELRKLVTELSDKKWKVERTEKEIARAKRIIEKGKALAQEFDDEFQEKYSCGYDH